MKMKYDVELGVPESVYIRSFFPVNSQLRINYIIMITIIIFYKP